jgi:hypothetical protein
MGLARVLTDLANVDLQAGDHPHADRSFKGRAEGLS